jgi:hypothetical protein
MKYEVSIDETVRMTCVVEAATEAEARTKGYALIMNGRDDEYDSESLGTDNISVVASEEQDKRTTYQDDADYYGS